MMRNHYDDNDLLRATKREGRMTIFATCLLITILGALIAMSV